MNSNRDSMKNICEHYIVSSSRRHFTVMSSPDNEPCPDSLACDQALSAALGIAERRVC